MKVNIVYLPHYVGEPLRYETSGSSGFDLRASFGASLGPMERTIVKTGLKVEVPKGYELQVRPRSGMAWKQGLTVLNTPGTVDSDYRGEVGIILINLSKEFQLWNPGDRLAQGVICPVVQIDKFISVKNLSDTERGSGAYNSTGVK